MVSYGSDMKQCFLPLNFFRVLSILNNVELPRKDFFLIHKNLKEEKWKKTQNMLRDFCIYPLMNKPVFFDRAP